MGLFNKSPSICKIKQVFCSGELCYKHRKERRCISCNLGRHPIVNMIDIDFPYTLNPPRSLGNHWRLSEPKLAVSFLSLGKATLLEACSSLGRWLRELGSQWNACCWPSVMATITSEVMSSHLTNGSKWEHRVCIRGRASGTFWLLQNG